MKTIIDFRLEEKFSPSLGAFLEQLWIDMATAQPEHAFVFLTEVPDATGGYPPPITVKTVRKSGFGWLDRKRLLTLLEEENAGMYVSFAGGVTHVCPLQGPATYKKDLQQTPLSIVFSGAGALQQPAQPAGRLQYIRPALPDVITANALSWTETESIRTQYTGGREYFLFTGDIDAAHRLVELLKAFSLFKKWQQSNMQIVLAGFETPWTDGFEDKLATYKYRSDVVLLKDLEWKETVRLAAAAYAMVYPSVSDTLPVAPLLALQAGIPLIASDIPVLREPGDVAEWVDNSRLEEGLSQAMMRLYKDEGYKQQLVQKAKPAAADASRPRMLEAMGELIGAYPLPLK
jgi:glycosyltransferase involved in cell wall biosynthesis